MTWTSITKMKFKNRIAEVDHEDEKSRLSYLILRAELLVSRLKSKKMALDLDEAKNKIDIKNDLKKQKIEAVKNCIDFNEHFFGVAQEIKKNKKAA